MLKHRILTALILIPLTLAILFYLPTSAFLVLTGLITLLGAWEWSNLMGIQTTSRRLLYLGIVSIGFVISLFIPVDMVFYAAFLGWILALVLVSLYPKGKDWWNKNLWSRGVMGLFVLIPCWVAINYIRSQSDGTYSLLFLFVLIWGADSTAYFVGKKWGKTKLAPTVSPGKSIQGVGGAFAFTVVVTVLALWLCQIPLRLWVACIVLSIVTIFFSIVGDLFESMLKREAGLKDSGQLLPGHGGVLDRIDSLTAAAPIFALGAITLGNYFS